MRISRRRRATRDAIDFFQTDLYGSVDFARRDADLARVVPVMMMMLPERVIATVAQAMELNALSHELDRALLAQLPRQDGVFTRRANTASPIARMGNRPARERQIGLIGEIGAALDVYVKTPLIQTALMMMRGPARLAGVGVLHDFLERGFAAFRKMHGAVEFLATIDRRERAADGSAVRRRDGAAGRVFRHDDARDSVERAGTPPARSAAAGGAPAPAALTPSTCRSTCRTACALRPRSWA